MPTACTLTTHGGDLIFRMSQMPLRLRCSDGGQRGKGVNAVSGGPSRRSTSVSTV